MPINVYYLDDEETLCDIFSKIVSSDQINVTTFSDPAVAIDACKENPPGILFIDYRLPGTTGDLVASKIDGGIPKVLVTGDLNCESNYKFDQVISKPCDYKEIARIISNYM